MKNTALDHDESGAVFVELAVLLPVLITVLFGSVDLLFAFHQWNAAAKAVEVGARIAAVSDPVAVGLNRLSDQTVLNGVTMRAAMPSFTVICDGGSLTCNCTGACDGILPNAYSTTAMDRIVYGRGSTTCGDAKSYYASGMCDILPSIAPANVVVIYQQSGLGYAGRPGGPIPTITVSLQNMTFQFFFLSAILGKTIPMPAMTTTITAEDLCSGGTNGSCGS
jgi:hypothetical protein